MCFSFDFDHVVERNEIMNRPSLFFSNINIFQMVFKISWRLYCNAFSAWLGHDMKAEGNKQ